MTRSKQVFEPRADRVKIFTCGPSTYRRPHIGNYRTFLYEDVLVRYLEHLGYTVQRIINFTDVEDKSLQEALEQGRRIEEMTGEVADRFAAETRQLRIKLPPHIPRSSTSVDQAVELIERLVGKGYAYRYGSNFFFDPLKFDGFGRLFGLDMTRWPKKKVRFKKDTYNGRRWNRGDFILWHGESPSNHEVHATAAWDTRIGRGRPSWNIQDPAIIVKHLGFTVDINCGGIDNIYRHHDYNLAILEALSGQEYARTYMHGEHLMVDGKPMAKSRGNILYIEDVLSRGYEPHHLRFFLIHTHYRSRLNYTEPRFQDAAFLIDSIRNKISELLRSEEPGVDPPAAGRAPGYRAAAIDAERLTEVPAAKLIEAVETVFREEMNDDLRIGPALDRIHGLLTAMVGRNRLEAFTETERAGLKEALSSVDSVCRVLL